ncbi:hypothetical protein OXX80_005324 [Metschnikowia pulcherrima]
MSGYEDEDSFVDVMKHLSIGSSVKAEDSYSDTPSPTPSDSTNPLEKYSMFHSSSTRSHWVWARPPVGFCVFPSDVKAKAILTNEAIPKLFTPGNFIEWYFRFLEEFSRLSLSHYAYCAFDEEMFKINIKGNLEESDAAFETMNKCFNTEIRRFTSPKLLAPIKEQLLTRDYVEYMWGPKLLLSQNPAALKHRLDALKRQATRGKIASYVYFMLAHELTVKDILSLVLMAVSENASTELEKRMLGEVIFEFTHWSKAGIVNPDFLIAHCKALYAKCPNKAAMKKKRRVKNHRAKKRNNNLRSLESTLEDSLGGRIEPTRGKLVLDSGVCLDITLSAPHTSK